MKKSDLRSGMWVKYRNGEMMMVLLKARNADRTEDIVTGNNIWGKLDNYTDDLKCLFIRKFDIMTIWRANKGTDILNFSEENFCCIWKREEMQYITKETAEKIIYVETGEEIKIKTKSINCNPTIPELIEDAHSNAIIKGWWHENRSLGDIIALMHSELSEMLEEGRKGKSDTEIYYEGKKPCGIPVELADLVIRVFDYCGAKDINLEKTILEKIEFNKTRPYKHGKKY